MITKVKTYVHMPNATECGIGNTHDCYLRITKEVLEKEIFTVGEKNQFTLTNNGSQFTFNVTNGREIRVNKFGKVFSDNNVEVGDEIVFQIVFFDNSEPIKKFSIIKHNKAVFHKLSQGYEIIYPEKIERLLEERSSVINVYQENTVTNLHINYLLTRKKRADSPIETDYYSVDFAPTYSSYAYVAIYLDEKIPRLAPLQKLYSEVVYEVE